MMVDETKMSLWKNKTALIFALEKIPFFDDLSDNELHSLMQYMSLYELEAGEVLFQEGEIGRYVGFIVEGKLEVLKKSVTGSEVSIANLSQGYSIGEMSLIDQEPRSATIKAKTKATLAVLSQSAFQIVLRDHHEMAIKILIGFARFQTESLRKTSNQLNAYTHLMGTMLNPKNPLPVNEINKLLTKDAGSKHKSSYSVSTVSASKEFLRKVRDILNKEII